LESRPTACSTAFEEKEMGYGVQCDHPRLQLTTCRERIAGQDVWIAAGRRTGWSDWFFAEAIWQYAPNTWIRIAGEAKSREDQVQLLRMLRSVMMH
jgi:hypothetical protein